MRLPATVVIALLSLGACGQGVVNFSNASFVPGWANPTLDRYARWGPGVATGSGPFILGDPVSSNYAGLNLTSLRAVLYYAASTDFDASFGGFVQASGGAATLRPSTSATAGAWFGGNRTLDTIPIGTTANLVVIVWDSSVSTDPLGPLARASPFWGASSIFQYTPPILNPFPGPALYLMNGLTSFEVGAVPEPTTLALGGLGAAVVVLTRHRRGNKASPGS